MNRLALIAFALWTLCVCYLSKIIQFLRLWQWARTIPGPSVAEFMTNGSKGEVLDWFKQLRQTYGPVFRIWLGKDLMVFFTEPEDVKKLLSSSSLLYKSSSYGVVTPWLGKGLLTNGGPAWHARRKLLTPAFHFRILSEFKEPMEENCRILVRKLREKADGEQFDIYPFITLFALDAICETAMGIRKQAQVQSQSEYVRAVQDMCRILHKKSFAFWQRHNILYKWSSDGKAHDAALKVLHDETERVITLRRQLLEEFGIPVQPPGDSNVEGWGAKRRLAFLDILLISQAEGVAISDREIREEVDTFMFEGHDTTSSALAFAIYLLSQHAEVQQRAYEEVLQLEGREKEPMPYVEALIKETLRIYPSVPFFSRAVHEDLQVGSITVPAGAAVSVLVHLVHRDENNFPEPEKFDPSRFLNKEIDLHPYSFVAFSAGPRNCIGQKFAMLELKCSLSHLLRNFQFLPVEGFTPKPLAELVTKSGNGIQIRMKLRTREK